MNALRDNNVCGRDHYIVPASHSQVRRLRRSGDQCDESDLFRWHGEIESYMDWKERQQH